jgi:hypothetical protein
MVGVMGRAAFQTIPSTELMKGKWQKFTKYMCLSPFPLSALPSAVFSCDSIRKLTGKVAINPCSFLACKKSCLELCKHGCKIMVTLVSFDPYSRAEYFVQLILEGTD